MLLYHLIILISMLYVTKGQDTTTEVWETSTGVTDSTPNVTEYIEPTTTEAPEICNNETQWRCKNGKCIDKSKECDGVIDCRDGSDEYRDKCSNITEARPLFGLILHCSSFWTPRHEGVCPEICEKSPEFCYYALMAENKENNTCLLPHFPKNGFYTIKPYSNQTAITDRVNFLLDYTCYEPYVMVQESLLRCEEGQWLTDPYEKRNCSEACPLYKNDNFTYVCPVDLYNKTDCQNYVAIGTTVTVSKKFQDEELKKLVTVEIVCQANKTFPISTDCVQEVDDLQQEFENPTMLKMTEYEGRFNQFKANETSNEFHRLVDEFHTFEKIIRTKLDTMHEKAEKCDISLDLLLHILQQAPDKKNTE